MYPRHESARRHRDTSGYRAVLLVAAGVVTVCSHARIPCPVTGLGHG